MIVAFTHVAIVLHGFKQRLAVGVVAAAPRLTVREPHAAHRQLTQGFCGLHGGAVVRVQTKQQGRQRDVFVGDRASLVLRLTFDK